MFCWTRLLLYLVQSSSVFFLFAVPLELWKPPKETTPCLIKNNRYAKFWCADLWRQIRHRRALRQWTCRCWTRFWPIACAKKTHGAPKKRRKSVQAGSTMKIDVFQYFPLTKRLNFMGYVDQGVAYWRWSTKNGSWWKLFQISLWNWAPSFMGGDSRMDVSDALSVSFPDYGMLLKTFGTVLWDEDARQ